MALIHVPHTVRRLLRSPLFTAITMITLAVGIGANTAIFSIVRGVLLKPLPYPAADRLVGVWESASGFDLKDLNASPATYFTFHEENRTFEGIGIWQGDSVSVTGLGEPEQIPAIDVSYDVLPILGVQPTVGRWFTKADDSPGSPGQMILSWGYWQRRFGGNGSVIGRRILVDGKAREVIGIMPHNFRFLDSQADVYLPLGLDRSKVFVGNFSYQSVARLRPGVSIAQANADEARMLPMMLRKFPPAPGISMALFEQIHMGPNLRPLKQDVVGDVGKVLWVLMGTVGIVLFIACANVANLLLVRAEGRQMELAIRAALGAGWGRIARELLVESSLLGLVGGVAGLGLAAVALRILVVLAPANLPRLAEISIDPLVLLFTLAVSLISGLLFGLVPVFKYAGPRLASALREGGRSLSEGRERHRTRSILVVVQVALALVLLISSGLMIRTFQALRRVEPGFHDAEHILTVHIGIPDTQVRDNDRVISMENAIIQKVSEIGGVSSVSMANSITMDGYSDNDPIDVEGRPFAQGKLPLIRRHRFAAPGLFRTMGNPLLAGRDMTWVDNYQKRPVVLVSENLAREYWGSPAAAIGKRIRENPKGTWREIIGVVGDERDDGVDKKAPGIVYWPLAITNFWGDALVVRRYGALAIHSPRTGSASFLAEVRQAIWSVNKDMPIADVKTVQEIYRHSMARTSFLLLMLAIASGMALLLGIVGIYGVISYSISQRTREIGIRMALGAEQSQVRRMFVRHGLLLTAIGVACGLAVAVGLSRVMTSLLFDVSPVDPITYLAVSAVLIAAALLASYIPARRATSIDPADALRTP